MKIIYIHNIINNIHKYINNFNHQYIIISIFKKIKNESKRTFKSIFISNFIVNKAPYITREH